MFCPECDAMAIAAGGNHQSDNVLAFTLGFFQSRLGCRLNLSPLYWERDLRLLLELHLEGRKMGPFWWPPSGVLKEPSHCSGVSFPSFVFTVVLCGAGRWTGDPCRSLPALSFCDSTNSYNRAVVTPQTQFLLHQ